MARRRRPSPAVAPGTAGFGTHSPRAAFPIPVAIRPLAWSVFTALAMQAGAMPAALAQQTPPATRDTGTRGAAVPRDVPSGPLGRALSLYAAGAGVVLSFDSALTDGLTTGGLQGAYTVQQGFDALLAGTGLEPIRNDDGSYALRRSASGSEPAATTPADATSAGTGSSAASSTAAATFPAVTVKGTGLPGGPDPDYVARRNSTATKTDTANLETAQAISVVTRDQMDDQSAAPALQDSLRYTPGLVGTRGVNLTDDSFNVRGFAAGLATSSNTPVFRDGLRQAPAMYPSTVEPYGLERIDVLRGPGSPIGGEQAPAVRRRGRVVADLPDVTRRMSIRLPDLWREHIVALHRYAGLVMAAFLIIAAVTGSLLAYRDDLDGWLAPELFVA